MGNAIWLFISLPMWYVGAYWRAAEAWPLSAPPVIGAICLLLGMFLSRASKKVFLFLWPMAAAQIYVVMSGLYRGDISHAGQGILTWGFMGGEIIACAWLIWLLKGLRPAAVAFSLFVLSYVLYAIFIGAMSMSDTWL